MNNSFNPFAFEGRLGRGRYFGYTLLIALIGNVIVFGALFGLAMQNDGYISDDATMLLGYVVNYGIALLTVSYLVRRLHDLGRSGKWAIAFLAPWGLIIPWPWLYWGLAGVAFLYVLLAPGTDGANEYGTGR